MNKKRQIRWISSSPVNLMILKNYFKEYVFLSLVSFILLLSLAIDKRCEEAFYRKLTNDTRNTIGRTLGQYSENISLVDQFLSGLFISSCHSNLFGGPTEDRVALCKCR